MLKGDILMKENLQLNADRFLGFADIYNNARPKCPEKVKKIMQKYLGKTPDVVVDLGCGTGLSTRTWSSVSNKVIGIEPSADIITCSQSFHWMNPEKTLKEVSRILKKGGVFATYDYDWPPVCNWEAELVMRKDLFQWH